MPFRWLPSTYGILTLVTGMLISMVIAVAVSNANTNRAVARMAAIERQRQADEKKAAEAGREASCTLIKTMADAYAKDRPVNPSATYDNVLKAWADLAKYC